MRHILTFCLLLSAICLTAQTWPKDSTWNAKENNTWYTYRQTIYENGSLTLQKEYVGTDSTLASTKTSAARAQSATMANDARAVQKFRKQITETIRNAAATKTQIGIDPLKALQDEVAPSLTGAQWELRTDTVRTITFGVNAQGVLRYTVIGFPTRQVNVLGDVMRLDRFLGSKDPTDLYRDGSVWRNLSGSVVLRPAGSSQSLSRTSLAPPTGGVVTESLVQEATVIQNPMVMQEPAKPKARKAAPKKKKQ